MKMHPVRDPTPRARLVRAGVRALRVFVVDRDADDREAAAMLLAHEPDVEVLGHADPAEAAGEVGRLSPDLVLLDVDARTVAGRRMIADLRTAAPRARILVVCAIPDPAAVLEALVSGASGYLLDAADGGRLLSAIHRAMDGHVPIEGEIVDAFRERLARPAPRARTTAADTPLTARELTVLRMVADGLTNEQIARDLVLSPGTVKLHVQHIIGKLGIANRTQAAVYAARHGLLGE